MTDRELLAYVLGRLAVGTSVEMVSIPSLAFPRVTIDNVVELITKQLGGATQTITADGFIASQTTTRNR